MKIIKLVSILILVAALSHAQTPQTPTEPAKKRVGNIDPNEKDRFRTRFEAKDSRYFSFGPGFGTNLNNTNVLYSFTSGYEWEVGAQGALLTELFATFGESTAIADASMGGKYFFSDEDASPFLKATFGMGVASIKDTDSVTGFSAKVGAGMTFFRTSTKHIEVSASYATIFKKAKEGNPGVFVVSMTLLY
jgi:hypothetical protein